MIPLLLLALLVGGCQQVSEVATVVSHATRGSWECPVCHETVDAGDEKLWASLQSECGRGKIVHDRCAAEAERQNKERHFDYCSCNGAILGWMRKQGAVAVYRDPALPICPEELADGNDEAQQANDGGSGSQPVLMLLDRKFLAPLLALLGLPLFVFGRWLNSYGIDNARLNLITIGWVLQVVGGLGFALALLPAVL